MKNIFEVSDSEKNRIINLHETLTDRQYLTTEQVNRITPTVFPPQNIGNIFKVGEYESDNVKNAILSLKPKIEEFIKKSGGNKFLVTITSGESNITNPKGFEQKGSLALARSNSVKKYFEEIFPELIQKHILTIKSPSNVNDVVLGKTPYKNGDLQNRDLVNRYGKEQFVRFEIKGQGEIIENICEYDANIVGKQGDPSNDFITTNDELSGVGYLHFKTDSIPDRLILINKEGKITKDTGYVTTLKHKYSDFIYVPLYVAELTKYNGQNSVSGDKMVKFNVISFEDLMVKLLKPNTVIPDNKNLYAMGNEVYNGVKLLKDMFNSGTREFIGYIIEPTIFITIPFNGNVDAFVRVYSPVGSTGYKLTGVCQ